MYLPMYDLMPLFVNGWEKHCNVEGVQATIEKIEDTLKPSVSFSSHCFRWILDDRKARTFANQIFP